MINILHKVIRYFVITSVGFLIAYQLFTFQHENYPEWLRYFGVIMAIGSVISANVGIYFIDKEREKREGLFLNDK